MTYSKTVRLGGSGNFAAREIDDKTRAVLADMSDFDANNTEIEGIAADIFTPGSGIHDDEVKKIMRVRVSSKQMDLDQQVAASNKVIKRLKDTLSALSIGKSEFITRAVQSEKQARAGWAQALETAQLLDEDRGFFKQKVKQLEVDNTIWKDNAKDTMRELSLSEDKMQNLRNEIEELKDRLQDAESSHTQAMIALEVEKARNAESEKQQKIWQDQQQALQLNAATSQQVKQAQESLKASLHEETAKLRDTINQHSARIKELESELVLAETQFARATADAEAANAKAKSKDEDMKELMKSIREMQNSGQTREENANKLRREAESKVAELEKQLAVVNGEMNVFTHEKSTLRESLENTKRERAEALENLNTLKNQLDELKADLSSSLSQLTLEKELRSRSDQKEREERNERIALSAQMMAMTKEHAQMETQLNEAKEVLEVKWKKEIQIQEEKYKEKQFELDKANEKIAGLEGEISALKISLQNEKSVAVAESASEMSKLTAEINILRERMKTEEQRYLSMGMATEKQVEILEQQIRDAQAERRKMHNLIQELRGNVRVFARVRPFLPNDNVPDDATACVIAKSESALKLHLNGDEKNEYKFEFDRVFGPSVGQEAVFEEVSEFVQSALDGYQVCLFSYGQTGSGKTHSMQGSGNGQMRGIIPRAIEQVGDYKAQLERDGWRYEMQVSFVEIYNETIRDLLRDDNSGLLKHEIKVNPDGRRYVTDINMVPLEPTDSDAVEAVMRLAARHRSVGSTDMNAQSSRSHSVFTLHLTAVNPVTKQSLRGNLNLVDLAGSERLDRSKATGDRAKEAMAINKSLSALTDVFVSIGKKASHVPFRNSKLTYLLQPSLSGDGKTLMMVNLSPTEQSTQESLCSLRFASQVNKCELGKAKRSLEEVADEDEEGADAMTSTSRPGGGSTNARANPARKSSTVSNVNRKSATSNRR
jgi:kinesin family protein C1